MDITVDGCTDSMFDRFLSSLESLRNGMKIDDFSITVTLIKEGK